MRSFLQFMIILTSCAGMSAQTYFPVKVDNLWGLMDAKGEIITKPVYDGIGEFKQFGYAVMQRNGRVGMLNNKGKEIITPKFDDIKILDSLLIAVMDDAEWMVINLKEEIVLEKGYEQVNVFDSKYLRFMKEKKWGIADACGNIICQPTYDKIELLPEYYFQTTSNGSHGLMSLSGKIILEPICSEIKIYDDNLFLYKQEKKWGAVNPVGEQVIEPSFDAWNAISEKFIQLRSDQRFYVYSVQSQMFITKGEYQGYYPFSKHYILVKQNRQLGLMDWRGQLVLAVAYNEIQGYGGDKFRVNQKGKWGILSTNDEQLIPFEYDYIAPLKGLTGVVKKGRFFGVVNFKGEEIVPSEYSRIKLSAKQVKAFKGEALSLFHLDKEGSLVEESQFKKHTTLKIGGKKKKEETLTISQEENDYLLMDFEWFYSPQFDKWGLRKLSNGEIQIEPTFDKIKVERSYGFTIVGIEKRNKLDFEHTSYRFDMVYGLVNNEKGLLVTNVNLWDIRIQDFKKGLAVARCVFENGLHGIINRKGKILKKDYAYIGDFNDGIARVSMKGKLSGSFKKKEKGLELLNDYLANFLSPSLMIDHTLYDQEFESEAMLTCDACKWGYLDTSGQVIVTPQYSFAQNFVNNVGLVQLENKWGMVGKDGIERIPCKYDELDFLENSKNSVLQIFTHQKKYGLIDTSGQVRVDMVYDDIGRFRDHRLAVKRDGMWGFVNEDGVEVIPCQYKRYKDFNEGFAAVQLGINWGIIDKYGDVQVEFKFKKLGSFYNGLAWASHHKGMGYIDFDGHFVIIPKYDKVFDFENNVARVVVGGKYGLINRAGDYLLRPKYKMIYEFNKYGCAIVSLSTDQLKYGLLSRSGDLLTTQQFKKIASFKEGLAAVKLKNAYGFIDHRGKLVIDNKYSKVSNFSGGRAMVQLKGVCGYIDAAGNEIVKPQFSKCLDFDEGKAVVYKGYRKAGLIDEQGAFIIEPSINRMFAFSEGRGLVRDNNHRFYYITEGTGIYNGYYQKASEFKDGVAVVCSGGKWGIINQKGIEVVPPKYDKIDAFNEGYAKVRIKRFSGLMNLKGDLIVNPEYESISYAGEGLFRAETGNKIGYFDTKGRWVWEMQE